jgi:hypothetical protein
MADPVQPTDTLTLTLRLWDPKEKKNAKLAASWVVVQVPREDLQLQPVDFAAKHLMAAVEKLEHFKPKPAAAGATVAAQKSHPAEAGASSHPPTDAAKAPGTP